MANHATLTNSVLPTSQTQANLKAMIQQPPTPGAAGVPVPPDFLQAFGLRVETDTTTAASPCVRTTEFDFGPSAAATVTATMNAGNTEVAAFNVTGAGLDYVVPPVISLAGGSVAGPAPGGTPQVLQQAKGRAFMKVSGDTIVSGGALYGANTVLAFVGGLPPALWLNPQPGSNKYSQKASTPAANGPPYCVQEVTVTKPGRNYPTNTQVRFVGGILGTGGLIAQAVAVVGANGQILSVQIIDPGFNYVTPPRVAFFDPTNPTTEVQTGFEAAASVSMAAGTPARGTLTLNGGGTITAIALTVNGDGYVQLPTMVVYDPSGAGSGAILVPRMGLSRVDVVYPGVGYSAAPTVTAVPFFKSIYPDTSDQRVPFWNLLKTAIQTAAATIDVNVSVVLS